MIKVMAATLLRRGLALIFIAIVTLAVGPSEVRAAQLTVTNLEDSGPGIPAEIFKRIFEPLFSTKGFGVGLGLPTVKQIMEHHGGNIEMSSELGRGTRALIWLPLTREAEIAA